MLRIAQIVRGLAVWLIYLICQVLLLAVAYPLHALLLAATAVLLVSNGPGSAVIFALIVGGIAFLLARIMPGPIRLGFRALRGWSRIVMGLRSLNGPNFGTGEGPRRRGFNGRLGGSTAHHFKETENNRYEA